MSIVALVPSTLLEWFDASPEWYWIIAWTTWGALLAIVALSLAREHRGAAFTLRIAEHLTRPIAFVGFAFAAILAFRWPMILAGPLMNPDETQLGAAAMTYWRDPIPWRSVDLHTSGPLNAYCLWPTLLFDGRVSYAELRLMALCAHVLAALALYGFFRRLTSDATARVAALPFITFIAFTASWEFVQYSSEQLSLAFIAIALWLVARALGKEGNSPRATPWQLSIAGFLLGCLPFAKMQAVPLGLTLGVFATIASLRWPGTWRTRFTRVGALLGGALAPLVLMAATLTIYGLWAQFRMAYIEGNSAYVSGYEGERARVMGNFIGTFVSNSEGFAPFFRSSLAVAFAAAIAVGLGGLRRRTLLVATLVLVAVGFWTVVYPGRPFGHYLHFLFIPLALLSGLSFLAALRDPSRSRTLVTSAVFLVITLVPQVVTRASVPHPALGTLAKARAGSLHPVSARLQTLAQPGDTMLVWGWFPRLYIESGISQGTREAHNYREINGGPMQRFFCDRTMRDLRKNRPAFIVDAVTKGSFTYDDRAFAGMQVFPELQKYVADNYQLEEDLGGYLIYLRRDRFSESSQNLTDKPTN
jgi:hypothetical protein